MNKLSSAQVQDLLTKSASAITQLAGERDFWKKEAQARMRHEEAEKVASAMHEKGIQSDVPYESLVAQMEKAAEEGKLEKIAAAVDLVGPNMGEKIGHLVGGNNDTQAPEGASDFIRFLHGTIGLRLEAKPSSTGEILCPLSRGSTSSL